MQSRIANYELRITSNRTLGHCFIKYIFSLKHVDYCRCNLYSVVRDVTILLKARTHNHRIDKILHLRSLVACRLRKIKIIEQFDIFASLRDLPHSEFKSMQIHVYL